MASFHDRLRADYDRTRDPLHDSPGGLGTTHTHPIRDKIAARRDIRTSLHGVESALQGISGNQMIPGGQKTFNLNNASYQASSLGMHGFSEEFGKNVDTAIGIAEIISGLEMMGGGGGFTFGTGVGAVAGVPMMAVGAVMTADGLRRLIGPLIAENARRFSNVLYSKRNSSGNVDFGKFSEAGKAHDRGGLTKAGRALDKHGNRPNSAFSKAKGNVKFKNLEGQKELDKILSSSKKIVKKNRFGGIDVMDFSGKGARFNADGTFRGFLEP